VKFIIVSGPSDSGKTSAINQFCKNNNTTIRKFDSIKYKGQKFEDFKAIGHIVKKDKKYIIDIASAGDDGTIINRNFDKFEKIYEANELAPDIILISIKTSARSVVPHQVTMERITQYLKLIGQHVANIESVITTIETHHVNPAQFDNERDRVVQAIYDAI
jgi:GTPase SAR1 family protein